MRHFGMNRGLPRRASGTRARQLSGLVVLALGMPAPLALAQQGDPSETSAPEVPDATEPPAPVPPAARPASEPAESRVEAPEAVPEARYSEGSETVIDTFPT